MMLSVRSTQVASSFVELVRSLRVLHLQPQCAFSSDAPSGNSGNDSSSSTNTESDAMTAEFNRRVAALHDSQAAQASVNTWLRSEYPSRQQAASNSWPSSSSSSADPSHPPSQADLTAAAAAATGTAAERSEAGEAGGSAVQVDPIYGYAVLGGIDPASSLQVAGSQQPKLHPTRNFRERETYSPLDLSPLAHEEEESWVPQLRRGGRPSAVPAPEVREQLDYKNIDFLLNFVSASGRIKPRRHTRLTPRLQAKVARTVKFARQMALIPYEMRVGDMDDSWQRDRLYRQGEREARRR